MPIDRYSVSSVPLRLTVGNVALGKGTGFFYERNGSTFIVSNWHVLSGRNPIDGQPTNRNGAIPTNLEFPACVRGQLGSWRNEQIDLVDEGGVPRWRQHGNRGQDVDIAILQIDGLSEGNEVHPINTAPVQSDMALMVGMDVYVLGFPLGQSFTACLPVWKRASIASEPDVNLDNGDQCFLIDTATREGMSGSPVITKNVGSEILEDGGMKMGGIYYRPLGVYSGRYVGDELSEMHLGKVWKWALVDEIIDNGVAGAFEIR